MVKLSRRKRKQQKQKDINRLKNKGYSSKQIQSFSNEQIRKESTFIVTEQRKVEKKRSRTREKTRKQQELTNWKFHELVSMGFDPEKLKTSYLRKIKKSDIERGYINRENYPFLFDLDKFDFDKIYTCKNGERLFFAFQDWSGELDTFDEKIKIFSKYTSQELLDFLEGAINMPLTGSKGDFGSSSGKAGTYKFQVAKQDIITLFNKETYAYNKQKPKRKKRDLDGHTLDYKAPFQILKNGGRNSFDKVTARNLLIIANAIMYNVNEVDRQAFYKEFYPAINRVLPEIGEILPKI